MTEPILIVLPFCSKDWQLTEKILQLCVGAYGTTEHECLLSYDDLTNEVFISRIQLLAAQYFSKVHLHKYDAPMVAKWPDACNHAFQRTAWHIFYKFKCPWLWLEGDAVPLRNDWIEVLQEEYLKAGKPFMGHIVEGMGHCNGVAIYPFNLCHYTKNALLVTEVAWDYVMKKETINQTHAANHLIGHIWNVTKEGEPINGEGIPVTFRKWGDVERYVDLSMCIFHRSKDGSLARLLLNKFMADKVKTRGKWERWVFHAKRLAHV